MTPKTNGKTSTAEILPRSAVSLPPLHGRDAVRHAPHKAGQRGRAEDELEVDSNEGIQQARTGRGGDVPQAPGLRDPRHELGMPDGGGKFDIIAEDEDSVVFVQVKGRDGRVEGFGFDEATMQRDDFERMSMSYLAENPDNCNCAVRFDVVAITSSARTGR